MSRARKIVPVDDLPRNDDGRRDWKAFLTSSERVEQEKLTARAQEIDAERRQITAQLQSIRWRCMTRRRYFEQHPGEAA